MNRMIRNKVIASLTAVALSAGFVASVEADVTVSYDGHGVDRVGYGYPDNMVAPKTFDIDLAADFAAALSGHRADANVRIHAAEFVPKAGWASHRFTLKLMLTVDGEFRALSCQTKSKGMRAQQAENLNKLVRICAAEL